MKNYEILKSYKKSDLRKLAKGKISEIVGMDSEKILANLSKVLGNYESIRNNIEFRKPPVNTILEVLLVAANHIVKFDYLKPLVIKKIEEYQNIAKEINLDSSEKMYHLYAKILNASWEYEGDLLPSEANILRVLRKELNISRKEHQYIMAHPQINRLFFKEEMYTSEIEYLTKEGIILIYEGNFVLSDETVDSIKELWGIELENDQFNRLLDYFSNSQLYKILKSFKLSPSGNHEEKVNRIISNDIKPIELLSHLSSSELSSYLKNIKLPQYGKKEEKIMKIIDHFKTDKDIVEPEIKVMPIVTIEKKILSDERATDLLSKLSMGQFERILGRLKLLKYGRKSVLVDRLVNSKYNIETVLDCLRLDDVGGISKKIGLKYSGNKQDLIKSIVSYYNTMKIKESKLSTKDLLEYYIELSCQDNRIYPKDMKGKINSIVMALDFERVTKYIFENIFHLETRRQRFGKEEPDGYIRDDGNIFFYECKTVLNPPYKLPISHRLQIRNYIQKISETKDVEKFKGYIIISHSFSENIEKKIDEINSPIDIPIGVIEARDLLAFAKKWMNDYPAETFPIKRIVKKGKVNLNDF